jgi:hypothetical protein
MWLFVIVRSGLSYNAVVCHIMRWFVLLCTGFFYYELVCFICAGLSYYSLVFSIMLWFILVCAGFFYYALHAKNTKTIYIL